MKPSDLFERCHKATLDALDGMGAAERRQAIRDMRGGSAAQSAVNAGRLLAALPASWRPRGGLAWLDHAVCTPAVAFAVRRAPAGLAGKLLDVKGDWTDLRRRLAAAHGGDGSETALRIALHDVSDETKAFHRQFLRPALRLAGRNAAAADRGIQAAANILQSGRSVRRIIEGSERWHAMQPAIDAALPHGDIDASWPALLPDAEFGGLTITVLTTRAQLGDEGAHGLDADGRQGLAHCVGAYAEDCLAVQTRILSLRRDGVRSSTVELTWLGTCFHLWQHRAHGNRDPESVDRHAMDQYLCGPVHRIPPAEEINALRRGRDATGYRWRDPGNWEVARGLWSAFLPRSLRLASPADWAALVDLPGILDDEGGWRARPFGLEDLPRRMPGSDATAANAPDDSSPLPRSGRDLDRSPPSS